ncbi:MAG: alpha/beta hydrolase [bacterium]|nr:alpha/beta hydrolase [bacterium]
MRGQKVGVRCIGVLGIARTKSTIVLCGLVLFGLVTGGPANSAVDVVCEMRFAVHSAHGSLELPYCASVDLAVGDANATLAVVVVHGINRNADDYYSYAVDAGVRANNANLTTAIIAPQFLAESDIERHSLQDKLLYWASSGWKKGNTSRSTGGNARPFRISSFGVLDRILLRLGDRHAFPRVRKIVVVGHSAGGQFTNRYAAGGAAEAKLAESRPDLSFRYVVANPSSYLYFSSERAREGTPDSFFVPDSANCPDYDDYHYGLQNLNRYMGGVGAPVLKQRYRSRRVVTLLGWNDSDPKQSSLAVGCAAMLQGHHRRERGEIYLNHILRQFGKEILDRHRFDFVPNTGHSARRMFRSDCGLRHLFDFGPANKACTRPLIEAIR